MRTIAAFCSVVLLLEMGPAASLAETAENLAAQEAERGPASTTAVLLEEDQEIREENVKYFFRSDGNREAAVYQEPVHYQEDGTWKDIDNTLVEVETGRRKNRLSQQGKRSEGHTAPDSGVQ